MPKKIIVLMRKSCLLFVFLLLALVAFKLSSSNVDERLEKPSAELTSDSENVELATN